MSLRELPLETMEEMLPEIKQHRVLAERSQRRLCSGYGGNHALGEDYDCIAR
jgi:hypothetical protein